MPGRKTTRFIPSLGFVLLSLLGLAMAVSAAGCQRPSVPPQTPDQTDPAHAERVEPSRPIGDAGAIGSRRPEAIPPVQPRPDRPPDPTPKPLPEPSPLPDPTPAPIPAPAPTPPGT